MSSWLWLLLAACLFAPIAYGLRRANELFALSARDGTLTIMRGRVPPALFSDLAEIAERARLDNAELRVLSVSGIPRLLMSDADGGVSPALEQAAQAARNVLGRFSVVQIRAGRLRASSARRL
jgi:hypothetical protein